MYHIYQFWQKLLIITINASLDVSERFKIQNKIYHDIFMCVCFLNHFLTNMVKKNMVKKMFFFLNISDEEDN